MVCYDAQGRVHIVRVRLGEGVGHVGKACRVLDNALEEIRVKVGLLALADRSNALKAHAGIDVGLCKGLAVAVCMLELCEHKVPDFQEAVAVTLSYAAVGATGHLLALVNVDFRTGAAGASVAHGPEVVLLAHAHNALCRKASDFLPQGCCLVVVAKDCHPQLVLGKLQFLCAELPGPGDGVTLEVVSEGEVAEHLEESVVACCTAHVFEVVVLAGHAQALLGRTGSVVAAILFAGEALLELDHAGVGE